LKCQFCGKEEVLPFKCQYCGGLFCPEHRLPENHACAEIERAKAPKEMAPPAPFEYKVTYAPPRQLGKFWFSPTEIKHLVTSAVLVMGVGLSYMLMSLGTDVIELSPIVWVAAALVFVGLFLLHEIAHKLMAQHYGMWAEFRLTLAGALITLLSIVLPFKIISPGAVMIAGYGEKEKVGKTAIAGPTVNIVLAAVSLALTFVPLRDFWLVAVYSALLNAYVAVFNLIPIGMLDGLKVFHWNKFVWATAFVVSLVLLIMILIPDLSVLLS